MDNDKVNAVLRATAARLVALGHKAERNPPDKPLPSQLQSLSLLLDAGQIDRAISEKGYGVALSHALWMCEETLAMPPEKLEKKMRWLGFVQGVLWMTGMQTVETAKNDNAPVDDEGVQDGG